MLADAEQLRARLSWTAQFGVSRLDRAGGPLALRQLGLSGDARGRGGGQLRGARRPDNRRPVLAGTACAACADRPWTRTFGDHYSGGRIGGPGSPQTQGSAEDNGRYESCAEDIRHRHGSGGSRAGAALPPRGGRRRAVAPATHREMQPQGEQGATLRRSAPRGIRGVFAPTGHRAIVPAIASRDGRDGPQLHRGTNPERLDRLGRADLELIAP